MVNRVLIKNCSGWQQLKRNRKSRRNILGRKNGVLIFPEIFEMKENWNRKKLPGEVDSREIDFIWTSVCANTDHIFNYFMVIFGKAFRHAIVTNLRVKVWRDKRNLKSKIEKRMKKFRQSLTKTSSLLLSTCTRFNWVVELFKKSASEENFA